MYYKYIYNYIYVLYIYMCVCLCVRFFLNNYIYIYDFMYIYIIYILLCVCVTSTSKLSRLVGGGATLVEVASPHQWEEAYWLRA